MLAVTPTTLSDSANSAIPAAPTTSWLETAVAILQVSPTALTALQIVAFAHSNGYSPSSQTRTPAQTVNRDLRAAVRRGDPRVVFGPGAGHFTGTAATAARAAHRQAYATPQLPIEPLVRLIVAKGGLRACGVRRQPGDGLERVRWAARLQRAYLRARLRGYISLATADELAVALLLHPCEVWGMQWWDAG